MEKLWHKDWELNKVIETFETQGDLTLDQQLVTYEVLGSLAHAKGLKKIGILKDKELRLLEKGLKEIASLDKQGAFILHAGDEDIHTKIENYLTQKYGAVGKKIHTGRSRNDQVLTAIRLFTKDKLLCIWKEVVELACALVVFSQKHATVLLPGYTHMQKAMPSTVGMWSGAIVEGLLDDLLLLKTAYQLNDQSPLGSAAGYGIPLSLDRKYTAQLLRFAKVQRNSLYCQNARGKIEAVVLAALIAVLEDINKLATDVLLFTTSEFGYFEVKKELCSGSSIMPQKKNVDIAELLRSKVHLLLGNYLQIVSLSANLPSGYNRDLQDSKKPLFESLQIANDSVLVATILVKNIHVNHKKTQAALTPELFATHQAMKLVKQGKTFRDAYQTIGKNLSTINFPISQVIGAANHIGGIGNLGFEEMTKHIADEKEKLTSEKKKWQTMKNILLKGGDTHEK